MVIYRLREKYYLHSGYFRDEKGDWKGTQYFGHQNFDEIRALLKRHEETFGDF